MKARSKQKRNNSRLLVEKYSLQQRHTGTCSCIHHIGHIDYLSYI